MEIFDDSTIRMPDRAYGRPVYGSRKTYEVSMRMIKRAREEGLSLRLTFFLMLIAFLSMTAILLFMSFQTIRSFRQLTQVTNDYIGMEEAASSLMSASDYLTEEAQTYTVIGDRVHLDNYFTEAEQTRRREHAIEEIEKRLPDSAALQKLRKAMSESVSLMDTEYYAMRLVLESQGDEDIPRTLTGVTLTEEDRSLSAEEKRALAERLMHNEEYNTQKRRIRSDFNKCVDALKLNMRAKQELMNKKTHNDLMWMVILIIVETMGLVLMLWLTTRLGINPLLQAVEHIKHDRELPIIGAHEFRYLAGTYNNMYSAYKKSIDQLSFKASHDELTGAFNRAGYDLIVQGVDRGSTAYLLLDADHFKQINDASGHKTGDLILMHIAATLKKNFRSDDYICRLGGDEFVVLMIHVGSDSKPMIEEKLRQVNHDLAKNAGELPAVSLSAGVSFFDGEHNAEQVYREADIALYHVKNHGRGGCCFYHPELEK